MTEYRQVSESSVVIFCSSEGENGSRIRGEIKKQAESNREFLFIDTKEEIDAWRLHESYLKILRVSEMFLFFGERNLVSIEMADSVIPFLYQEDLKSIRENLKQRQYDTAINQIEVLLEKKAMNSRNKEGLEELSLIHI